jgi:hypothetical protein
MGISFRVDFLALQMGRDLFAVLLGDLLQRLLGNREHAAGSTCAIVEEYVADWT